MHWPSTGGGLYNVLAKTVAESQEEVMCHRPSSVIVAASACCLILTLLAFGEPVEHDTARVLPTA